MRETLAQYTYPQLVRVQTEKAKRQPRKQCRQHHKDKHEQVVCNLEPDIVFRASLLQQSCQAGSCQEPL